MSALLDQLDDENLDFTVTITDTDGETGRYEFLDLVFLGTNQYAVVSPPESDGDIVIFRIAQHGETEEYIRVRDDVTMVRVFESFKSRHDDEFDFD